MTRNISQGDLVQVVSPKGIKFNGIVVKYYPARNSVYLRVVWEDYTKYMPNAGDVTLEKANWSRYGIHEPEGIFLNISECKSITLVHKATVSHGHAPYINSFSTNMNDLPKFTNYQVYDSTKRRVIMFTVIDTPQGEFGAFTQVKLKDNENMVDSREAYEARLASVELAQIYSILHNNGRAGKYEMR